MGYYSRAEGSIVFAPGLPRYALRGNEVIYKYLNGEYDLFLDGESNEITSAEGEFKAYWIVENLKELVAEILKITPSTIFAGYIQLKGEGDGTDDPDIWRLRVKDGKVEEVRPKLVWPD